MASVRSLGQESGGDLDKKPAEILDSAAAADASGQPMTRHKEAEEQPTQGRGVKRCRSADTASDK